MKPQTLPKLSLQQLHHGEFVVVAERIINEWNNQAVIPRTVLLLIRELTAHIATLRKILAREQGCELTKKIHELDALRDRAYKLFIRKIRNTEDEFDQALLDAWENLAPVADKYDRDIVDMSLMEETSQLLSAVHEFKKPQYEVYLTTLNLHSDIDRVDLYNTQFEQAWIERSALEGTGEKLPLLRVVRQYLEQQLRLLLSVTDFLHSQEDESVSDTLYSVTKTELSKMSALLKRRKTLAKNEENGES